MATLSRLLLPAARAGIQAPFNATRRTVSWASSVKRPRARPLCPVRGLIFVGGSRREEVTSWRKACLS